MEMIPTLLRSGSLSSALRSGGVCMLLLISLFAAVTSAQPGSPDQESAVSRFVKGLLSAHMGDLRVRSALQTIHQEHKNFSEPWQTGKPCTLATTLTHCRHQVCVDGLCMDCSNDIQCQVVQASETYSCAQLGAKTICRHSPIFSPVDMRDVYVAVAVFCVCFVSAAGGLGGGGVLVPLYVLIKQIAPHDAIPLSKATTFGTAIANLAININQRHPHTDRPLIDFSTCCLLVPCQLLGTVFGVIVNGIMPEWMITLLLFVLLVVMTAQTCQKGMRQLQKESRAMSKKEGEEMSKLFMNMVDDEPGPLRHWEAHIVKERERTPAVAPLLSLAVLWVSLMGTAFFKGGAGLPWTTSVVCGSVEYFALLMAVVPLCFTALLYNAYHIYTDYEYKVRIGFKFVKGDVVWTKLSCIFWPLSCTTAGIASGALGLGGGTVTSPIMLMMGMEPRVVAASAAFMILFTASSTSVQYVIAARLQLDYAAFFFAVAFASCLTGHYLMNRIMRRSDKTAYVVLIIAAVVGASAVGIGLLGVNRFITAVDEGGDLGFHSLCA